MASERAQASTGTQAATLATGSGRRTFSIVRPHNFFAVSAAVVKHEINLSATVTFTAEVDLTAIEAVRARAAAGSRPSYTAFVAKALAQALHEFPYANRRLCRRAWWPFGRQLLQQFHTADICIAVERDVPGIEVATFIDVLSDPAGRSLGDITGSLRDLAASDTSNNEQWRTYSTLIERFPAWLATILVGLPRFLPGYWSRYRGGSAIISAPCKYGVDGIVAAWTHPIGVSFSVVRRRPVVRGDAVVPCPTFNLILNWDRRIMAGAQAARFFKRLVDLLESQDSPGSSSTSV